MKYTHRVVTAQFGPPGFLTNEISGDEMQELYPVIPVIESWDHAEIPVELLTAMGNLRCREGSYYCETENDAVSRMMDSVYVLDHAVALAARIRELVTSNPVVLQ